MSNEPQVTVVVDPRPPTRGMEHALRSALNQSMSRIEVLLVDGMAGLPTPGASWAQDPRVRTLSPRVSPTTTEELFLLACREARSPFVCYLSTQTLWLPDHLTVMARLLQDADVAHTLQLDALPGARFAPHPAALDQPSFRNLLAEGRAALGTWGHRTSVQKWGAEAVGTPTSGQAEGHFWRRLLSAGGPRIARSPQPTFIHFAHALREAWSPVYVEQERASWSKRLEGEDTRSALQSLIPDALTEALLQTWSDGLDASARADAAELAVGQSMARMHELELHLQRMTEDLRRVGEDCQLLNEDRLFLRRERRGHPSQAGALGQELERQAENQELRGEIQRLENSATWRLKERIAKVPWVSDALRKVVRGLAQ